MDINLIVEGNRYYLNFFIKNTNQLNLEVLKKLYVYLIKIEKKELGIVILRSNLPNIFSSGLDMHSVYEKNNKDITYQNVIYIVKAAFEINAFIIKSKHIYLAAINGATIGTAFSLVLACDIRVTSGNAWFWLPDPQYGGIMVDGGLELLTSRAGTSINALMSLTNHRYSADNLLKWGLVMSVYSKEEFQKAVNYEVDKLISNSLITLSYSKKIINKDINMIFKEEYLNQVLHQGNTFERLSSYIQK